MSPVRVEGREEGEKVSVAWHHQEDKVIRDEQLGRGKKSRGKALHGEQERVVQDRVKG